MSHIEAHSFSPFYKVKKPLLFFRYTFGFPLTATNGDFSHFEFNSWKELFRYILFWIIFCSSGSYGFYISYKCTKEINPKRSLEKVWSGIGLSYLDLGVMTALAPINHFCNILYILSFRNGVTGINKILKHLTTLNETCQGILMGKNDVIAKTRRSQFYLKLRNFFLIIIAVLAAIMLAYSWVSILFKKYPNILSFGEKATLVIILTMADLVYIYTPTAKSADFVVGFLLDETTNAFGYFNSIIISKKKRGTLDIGYANQIMN